MNTVTVQFRTSTIALLIAALIALLYANRQSVERRAKPAQAQVVPNKPQPRQPHATPRPDTPPVADSADKIEYPWSPRAEESLRRAYGNAADALHRNKGV